MFLHNDGHSEQYAGCCAVFLQLLEPAAASTVQCAFKFFLLHPLDAAKNITKPSSGQKSHAFKVADTNWGFYELVRRERLVAEKFLWPNDALVVEVEMEVSIGNAVAHEHVHAAYYPSAQPGATLAALAVPLQANAPCACALRRDITQLLANQTSADLVLLVGETREPLHTHRAVLEARSAVFRTMFASTMLDAHESVIELPDASVAAVRALLEFVYSDCVPDHMLQSFAAAVEVFQLADRFDLDRLTELVVPLITRHLSIANVFAAIAFADTHQHCAGGARLRRVALEFARQHFDEVMIEGTTKLAFFEAAFGEARARGDTMTDAMLHTARSPRVAASATAPSTSSSSSMPPPPSLFAESSLGAVAAAPVTATHSTATPLSVHAGNFSSSGGGIASVSASLFRPTDAYMAGTDLFSRTAASAAAASQASFSVATSVVASSSAVSAAAAAAASDPMASSDGG